MKIKSRIAIKHFGNTLFSMDYFGETTFFHFDTK
ncbi:hypothetical protein P872_16140 [Rhodonellum psychrophilum GCM71 = DSM 17998]|uniref:Uncharacterized protein n=1 Tax=Rhodonellum psychrophilum GCM71 = DSM 17998 TaxID=1123057 RepID=U5BZY0_9BACT|nr:hypothetical protein P872_16140 [Rhodonellum psychrophilum GCM71 = DSM 17998]